MNANEEVLLEYVQQVSDVAAKKERESIVRYLRNNWIENREVVNASYEIENGYHHHE